MFDFTFPPSVCREAWEGMLGLLRSPFPPRTELAFELAVTRVSVSHPGLLLAAFVLQQPGQGAGLHFCAPRGTMVLLALGTGEGSAAGPVQALALRRSPGAPLG